MDLLDQVSLRIRIIQEEGTDQVLHRKDSQGTCFSTHTRIHHTLRDNHLLHQDRNLCSNEMTEMLALIEALWQRHPIRLHFNDHDLPPMFIMRSNCNLLRTHQAELLRLLNTLRMLLIPMEDLILIFLHKGLVPRLSVPRRMVLHMLLPDRKVGQMPTAPIIMEVHTPVHKGTVQKAG
jgi:hypothetical protein